MTTRRISVNVGGLWRTSVELKEEATWYDLKNEINKVIGISSYCQKLEPNDEDDNKCELEEGDDVFCDWKLPYGDHPLHCAAKNENAKVIRSWLTSGADVNAVDMFGRTPLIIACLFWKEECEECVAVLLEFGANAKLIDNYGETALHKFAKIVDFEKKERAERIINMLIKAKCDLMISNCNGKTFIDILKMNFHHELAKKYEEWIKEIIE